MKKSTIKNSAPRVAVDSHREEASLAWAESMNEHAMSQINQLRSVAQLIASGNPDGSQHTETDRTDLLATMTLFTRTMEHVVDILKEVRGIIRQQESTGVAINT